MTFEFNDDKNRKLFEERGITFQDVIGAISEKGILKYFDKEEKDLVEALDNVDIHKLPSPDLKTQKMFKNAANHFVKQDVKMNIRISSLELEKIKKRAALDGLKYQTFVKSVLHKYLTGQLTEKKIHYNVD